MKIDDFMNMLKGIDGIEFEVTELTPEKREVRTTDTSPEDDTRGHCNGNCEECGDFECSRPKEIEELPREHSVSHKDRKEAFEMAEATVNLVKYLNGILTVCPDALDLYNYALKLASELPDIDYYIQVIKK
jgi:hypothetical protein